MAWVINRWPFSNPSSVNLSLCNHQSFSSTSPNLVSLLPSGECLIAVVWVSLKVSAGAYCWRCLWGCPVPTGSRPPCCPPPRESCGPGSECPAGVPSSQSQSSTLWPSPRRRARTAESCPQPAIGETSEAGEFRCASDSVQELLMGSYHNIFNPANGFV